MKQVFLWLFALLCLVISSCFMGSSLLFLESDAIGKPNLVANPDFENRAKFINRLPPGWIVNPRGLLLSETIAYDPAEYFTGKQSLKFVNTQRKLTLLSEPFRIDPWNGYYIKASFKSGNPSGTDIILRFQTYADDGTITNNFNRKIKTDSDWSKATISAGFIKKSATFARVLLIIPPTLDYPIWIDDVGCFSVHRFRLD